MSLNKTFQLFTTVSDSVPYENIVSMRRILSLTAPPPCHF